MTIERLHQALDSLGPAADARELSEILWLACHTSPTQAAEAPPAPATTSDDLPPAQDIPESPRAPRRPPQEPTAELHPRPPEPQSGSDATEILVPTAPMLTNALAVQRALRPLKRRVASPLRTELDEDATAARIADTALWVPVLTPSPERWLSLILVVDTGPSMRLWRPLGHELAETILRQGAFRDVQLTYLNESGSISSSPTAPARSPTTLLDPAGRHTTLVLSDCSGPHWWNGRAARALRRWAQTGPAAILQPLPERLWRRTAAPTTPGLASLPRPGAPNTELRFTPYDGEAPEGLPIPVLEIAPRWLSGWANLVAGAGPQPTAIATPTATTAAPVHRERELPPEERVRRFLVTASHEAAELAAHVAVSIPSLPVMRLIQHRVLGESGPGQLAEVLLSGLLRPVDHSIGHYEFVPGARAALLASLPRPEAWHTRHVLEQISAEIEPRIGSAAETFRALLPSAQGDRALPDRPFALISPEARALLDRTITPPPQPQVQAPPIAAGAAGLDVVHLGGTRLTAFVDGELGGEELDRALAHLAACDSCRREADVLRLVRDRLRGQAASPPSGSTNDRLVGLLARLGSSGGNVAAEVPSASLRLTVQAAGSDLSPAALSQLVRAIGEAVSLHTGVSFRSTTDEIVLLQTPGTNARSYAAALIEELAKNLREHHAGQVRAALVWTGAFPAKPSTVAERVGRGLLRHPAIGQALTDNPEARLALMLPDDIYRNALPQQFQRNCRKVEVSLPDEGFDGPAWIWVDHQEPAPGGRIRRFFTRFLPGSAEDRAPEPSQTWATSNTPPPEAVHPSAPSPPQPPELLELLGAPPPELIAAALTLRAGQTVPVPIGVGDDGEPVSLDLMGGYRVGSHGLIIGAPGSGRIALLRTIVAGLALTHPPRSVNFVLADLGAGHAFEGLGGTSELISTAMFQPSGLAALITALRDEIERRDAFLDRAQARSWSMYQGLLAREATDDPLSALFVVIDEFGPALVQTPGFAQILERVAQQGERLGIKLVLASTGVQPAFTERLTWRIALQNEPGVGYLYVGEATPTRFRTAQVPSDLASLFQTTAQPIADWTRRVDEWEPITLGVNDDGPVRLDIMDGFMPGHGLIVDQQQSGRSELARTLVTELSIAHPPTQLNFLLADYSAGTTFTGGLEELPHITDVILSIGDELSLADRLGEALVRELDRRQSFLDEARSAAWHHYQSSVAQGEPIPPLPALFVLVNVVDSLIAAKPEFQDVIQQIVERGPLLGVQLTMISTGGTLGFGHVSSWLIKATAEGGRLDLAQESTAFKLFPRQDIRALARTLSQRGSQAHRLMPRRPP